MSHAEIDEELVRTLLREQQPDLAGMDLRRAAVGWDNQLWRLGDGLAVRLPYATDRASSLLRKEYRWLPVLAPRLPLPVPTPLRIGEPSARFPKPWTIARWVRGEPGDRASISRAHHAADGLAGFLRALHQSAPDDAPAGEGRGVPLGTFAHAFDERLQVIAGTGADTGDAAAVREVLDDAVSAPGWEGPPVWLHGDLHPANVLVSGGTLSGVVDFGDLCAGDPATDLAAAWLILPSGAASRFFAAYAYADEAMIRRARGWAVLFGLSLIGIGQAGERGMPGGKPTWGPAGRAALGRVLLP